jgi:acyl carrier protein
MVLDEIFAGADLDFVVLCSSLNAVLGRAGQLDYAAANAFLDAFAQARARNERRLTVSIAWDAWSESGMAAEAELPSTLAEQRRKELDLGITDAEGVEVFRRVLHCSLPQVTVSTRDLERRIDECVNLEMGHAPELGTVKDTPPSQSNVDAPRHEIEQRIARIWQDALGIGQVGIHDNFTELGGHSLLAIRIVNELRRAFQVDLPVRVVFDAPTVAELSSHIKERLIADIEALTDDEAERLLSSN